MSLRQVRVLLRLTDRGAEFLACDARFDLQFGAYVTLVDIEPCSEVRIFCQSLKPASAREIVQGSVTLFSAEVEVRETAAGILATQ